MWSFERQEALLDEKVPNWRRARGYRDELSAKQRQGHSVAELVRRADLMRSTTRGSREEIVVASFACLGWGEGDLVTFLADAASKGWAVRALDVELTVEPARTAGEIKAALDAYRAGRRREAEEKRGKTGGAISAARREEAAKAKLEAIKDRWQTGDPRQHLQKDLLAEAGVTRNTALKHLGRRKRR